jgi:hypothetical protein
MSSNDAHTPDVFKTDEYVAMEAEHGFEEMFATLEVYIEFIRDQEIAKAAERNYDLEGMPVKHKADILHDRDEKFLEIVGRYVTEDGEDDTCKERGLRDVVTHIALVSSAFKRYSEAVGGDEGSQASLDALASAPFLGGLYLSIPTPRGKTA